MGFLWSVIVLWVFVHIVFFGEPRYRLPILPILTTFAAVALMELRAFLPGSSEREPTADREPAGAQRFASGKGRHGKFDDI
jgi:hypothetical protein